MHFKNQTLVIKVGSALLVNESDGMNQAWFNSFIDDIALLKKHGCRVVIVSSGAVSLGCHRLKFTRRQATLERKQAAAAVGQIELSQWYQRSLSAHGLVAAQILLSLDDSESRKRFLNARNTLLTLLKEGLVPIVNENDTVATDEIKYGDNDRLAARVAQMVDADTLILLSDVNGLYDSDPKINPEASLIDTVTEIDDAIKAFAFDTASDHGSGGMKTKIAAGQIAMSHGIDMLITAGAPSHPIQYYQNVLTGTWFKSSTNRLQAKKAWLKNHLKPAGQLLVDHGARQALLSGKSLLAVGIVRVTGHFNKGDVVSILDENDVEIAKGLTNYPDDEVKLIQGHVSSETRDRLGYSGMQEVIHRNNMVKIES